MKKVLIIFVLMSQFAIGQVGIGTTDPKGALDITSSNLGLVLPRVTQLEDVTNNNAGLAEDGTIVYDVSRNKTCFRIANTWVCIADDASLAITTTTPSPITINDPNEQVIQNNKVNTQNRSTNNATNLNEIEQ